MSIMKDKEAICKTKKQENDQDFSGRYSFTL